MGQDQDPYRSPLASDALPAALRTADWRVRKLATLAELLVVAAVAGAGRGLSVWRGMSLNVLDLAAALVFAGLLLRWLDYDARERDSETSRLFAVLVVLCPGPLVLLPLYLLQTREAGRKLPALFSFAGYVVLVVAAWLAGAAIATAFTR